MTNRALQRKIHVACRDLGLDSEARHDIQIAACGKASMRDMDKGDLELVIAHLKDRGWTDRPTKGRKQRKEAERADVRFIHVMWRLLGEAGELKQPGRAGLNAFIRSKFENKWGAVPLDVDHLTRWEQISDVSSALKAWCRRAGVELKR